jgi:hypothetical protein
LLTFADEAIFGECGDRSVHENPRVSGKLRATFMERNPERFILNFSLFFN